MEDRINELLSYATDDQLLILDEVAKSNNQTLTDFCINLYENNHLKIENNSLTLDVKGNESKEKKRKEVIEKIKNSEEKVPDKIAKAKEKMIRSKYGNYSMRDWQGELAFKTDTYNLGGRIIAKAQNEVSYVQGSISDVSKRAGAVFIYSQNIKEVMERDYFPDPNKDELQLINDVESYLIQHIQQSVPSAHLESEAWGRDAEEFANILERKRLDEEIEDDGCQSEYLKMYDIPPYCVAFNNGIYNFRDGCWWYKYIKNQRKISNGALSIFLTNKTYPPFIYLDWNFKFDFQPLYLDSSSLSKTDLNSLIDINSNDGEELKKYRDNEISIMKSFKTAKDVHNYFLLKKKPILKTEGRILKEDGIITSNYIPFYKLQQQTMMKLFYSEDYYNNKDNKESSAETRNMFFRLYFNYSHISKEYGNFLFDIEKSNFFSQLLAFLSLRQYKEYLVFLVGGGSNGKDLLIEQMFSKEIAPFGVTYNNLYKLSKSNFVDATLAKSPINVISEVPGGELPSSVVAMLKDKTGSEYKTIEPKGVDAYNGQIRCKYILTSNSKEEITVKGEDNNYAWRRRVKVFNCEFTFDPDLKFMKRGSFLDSTLARNDELTRNKLSYYTFFYLMECGMRDATKNYTKPFAFTYSDIDDTSMTSLQTDNSKIFNLITRGSIVEFIKTKDEKYLKKCFYQLKTPLNKDPIFAKNVDSTKSYKKCLIELFSYKVDEKILKDTNYSIYPYHQYFNDPDKEDESGCIQISVSFLYDLVQSQLPKKLTRQFFTSALNNTYGNIPQPRIGANVRCVKCNIENEHLIMGENEL